MARDKEDISGVNCLRGLDGKLIADEAGIKKAWKQHIEKVMNEENVWDQQVVCDRKEGPV